MILGKVVGTVWGSKQVENMRGLKVVRVSPIHLRGSFPGQVWWSDPDAKHLAPASLLAVDEIGADIGELVLVSIGSRARDLVVGPCVPTKSCVIAIVDSAVLATLEEVRPWS